MDFFVLFFIFHLSQASSFRKKLSASAWAFFWSNPNSLKLCVMFNFLPQIRKTTSLRLPRPAWGTCWPRPWRGPPSPPRTRPPLAARPARRGRRWKARRSVSQGAGWTSTKACSVRNNDPKPVALSWIPTHKEYFEHWSSSTFNSINILQGLLSDLPF